MAVMKVETDIIVSITASPIGKAVILVILSVCCNFLGHRPAFET
jgi:hypothetical protein